MEKPVFPAFGRLRAEEWKVQGLSGLASSILCEKLQNKLKAFKFFEIVIESYLKNFIFCDNQSIFVKNELST